MRKLKDRKKTAEMKYSSNNYKFKDYNIKDNRKRSFLSLEDYLKINTKLKFYSRQNDFFYLCTKKYETVIINNITFPDVRAHRNGSEQGDLSLCGT